MTTPTPLECEQVWLGGVLFGAALAIGLLMVVGHLVAYWLGKRGAK